MRFTFDWAAADIRLKVAATAVGLVMVLGPFAGAFVASLAAKTPAALIRVNTEAIQSNSERMDKLGQLVESNRNYVAAVQAQMLQRSTADSARMQAIQDMLNDLSDVVELTAIGMLEPEASPARRDAIRALRNRQRVTNNHRR